MRILFITATRIGDSVISTGLLDYLVEQYPHSRITVVCGPLASSLFNSIPGLEQIITLEKETFGLHWFKLWLTVRGRRWDLVVDLRRSLISYLLQTERRSVLGHDNDKLHRVEFLSTMFNLDLPRAPRLWVTSHHEAAAFNILPWDKPFIVVAPIAAQSEKTWPLDRFVRLVDRLTASDGCFSGCKVVVVGGEEDRSVLTSYVSELRVANSYILAGCQDLLVVAAILRRSALTIANDSGMAHVAAAAGSPTLALFGATKPSLYAPRGKKVKLVKAEEAGEGGSMADISVDEVYNEAENFLK